MAFWTSNTAEPVRSYRFKVSTVGEENPKNYWYAKSIDKPSFEVNTTTYLLTNHKFKYPGVVTWNDISLVIVDVGQKAAETLKMAFDFGYSVPDSGVAKEGMSKYPPSGNFSLIIEQLNAEGTPIETWTLYDAFIKSVDFGQLSYSDDEIVQISIGISYDYATLE